MSTEVPPTEPTEPVAPAPKDGPVKPDNWYNDSTTETPPEELLTDNPAPTAKLGDADPDNWYNDSEPKV